MEWYEHIIGFLAAMLLSWLIIFYGIIVPYMLMNIFGWLEKWAIKNRFENK